MKKILGFIMIAMVFFTAVSAQAISYERGVPFYKEFFFYTPSGTTGGTGGKSGQSYDDAFDLIDHDLMSIPAGAVIEDVFYIIDAAWVGPTAVTVGDDDDNDGFAVSPSQGTTGLAGHYSFVKGAYLKTTGATPSSTYVTPKYYSASGKEVKIDFTGAAAAGAKFRVAVKGYFSKNP